MTADPQSHVTAIGGLRVLFVMATHQEYGERLRALITPLIAGVGPVEAAAATGAALGALSARGRLPDLVFSLGSAGSRSLEHAAIYQIASIAYRDMDATALGFAKGVTPFLDEPATVAVGPRLPGIPAASIATGASIVSGRGYDAVAADMVDMESFAVDRAARRFAVPMIGLRGISDGRSDLAGLHGWMEYLHVIDHKLADAVTAFSAHVATGEFRLRSGAPSP
jgi:adenosylhomocysteine nucleosidase